MIAYLGLRKDDLFIGTSEAAACPDDIDLTVQQAFNANMSAQIMGRGQLSFRETGVFQLLIPYAESAHMLGFMRQYLKPLLETPNEKTEELLRTAVTFVLSENDTAACAERLFCHKNTVRYRVNSLHELLDPDANDASFAERLGIAIKIYLINQHKIDQNKEESYK